MKLLTRLIIVVALVFFASGDILAATGINRKINFQGKVVNKGVGSTDGTNVADGNYNFTFSLWSTLSAGTSLWSESWTGGSQVAVNSGIFQVALGTNSTFPPTVNFNSDSLYLSVNYNSDGEMTPRIRLAAVPYAFNAEKVMGLTVTATDGTLSIGDSKTITFGDNFTTINGVGITLNQSLATTDKVTFAGLSIGGSASVSTNLSVGGSVSFTNIPIGVGTTVLYIGAGGVLVQGTLPPGGAYTATNGLNLNVTALGLGGSLTQATQIGTSSYSLSFIGLGGTQALFIGTSGYVGIGTTNPTYKLEVAGSAWINSNLTVNSYLFMNNQIRVFSGSTGAPSYSFGSDTDTGLFNPGANTLGFSVGATEAVRVSSLGYVGIGTTDPQDLLDVNGSIRIGGTAGFYSKDSPNTLIWSAERGFSAKPLGVRQETPNIDSAELLE